MVAGRLRLDGIGNPGFEGPGHLHPGFRGERLR